MRFGELADDDSQIDPYPVEVKGAPTRSFRGGNDRSPSCYLTDQSFQTTCETIRSILPRGSMPDGVSAILERGRAACLNAPL